MCNDVIGEFRGKYRFLSNFFPCTDLHYDGLFYPTVEHAFQASKTLDYNLREKVLVCQTPGDAKRMGKTLPLRDNWELIKKFIMFDLVYLKFSLNEDLKKKLKATDEATLIEGNTWNDVFWGMCNGHGQNHLGKILMEVRGLLR